MTSSSSRDSVMSGPGMAGVDLERCARPPAAAPAAACDDRKLGKKLLRHRWWAVVYAVVAVAFLLPALAADSWTGVDVRRKGAGPHDRYVGALSGSLSPWRPLFSNASAPGGVQAAPVALLVSCERDAADGPPLRLHGSCDALRCAQVGLVASAAMHAAFLAACGAVYATHRARRGWVPPDWCAAAVGLLWLAACLSSVPVPFGFLAYASGVQEGATVPLGEPGVGHETDTSIGVSGGLHFTFGVLTMLPILVATSPDQ